MQKLYIFKYFKSLVIFILFFCSCFQKKSKIINSKKTKQIKHDTFVSTNNLWSLKSSSFIINLNFENEFFRVDTINEFEGPIYYHYDDTGYFRVNYVSPESKFECCEKYDRPNLEIQKKSYTENLTDISGVIRGTNLYWREIRYMGLIEIIFYKCPIGELVFYNRVMDNCKNDLLRYNNKK